MDVTIIIPLHNPDQKILKQIYKKISRQKFKGKIEIINVEKGLGLADSLNYGIKKSKTEIVVSLHQDSIPSSDVWLNELTRPLENKKTVASVSDVELPKDFWENFSWMGQIMSAKEQKILTPLMDEKGCAYKKSVLLKVGLFDGKTFRTAGEDFDMYIKLKREGEIVYPHCKILHHHVHSLKNRLKKEFQLSEGLGVLVRIYLHKLPGWWKGLLKAIPIVGWPFYWINFPYKRMPIKGFFWILISLIVHIIYLCGFWRGFLRKRQTF